MMDSNGQRRDSEAGVWVWKRALRVALVSTPYWVGLMVLVGIPARVLGGELALKIAIALALPVFAIYSIHRYRAATGTSGVLSK